jgi:hypothetical protein
MKTLKLKHKDKDYKIKVRVIKTNSNYNVSASLHDETGVLSGSIFKDGTTNENLKMYYKDFLIQKDKGLKCESCQWYEHTPTILGGIASCMQDVKPLNTFLDNEACKQHKFTNFDKLKAQNDYYDEHLNGVIHLNK